MDTEKKHEAEEGKPATVADTVGDLVVSAATVLAHTAAEAVVGRVKKAAAKTKPVRAVEQAAKKAKKAAPKKAKMPAPKKAKKASKKAKKTKTAKKHAKRQRR